MTTKQPEHLCVQRVPIFNHLPHAELVQIENLVRHQHFQTGEPLYLADSPAGALYIIHAGSVAVVRGSANGREQLVRQLTPGDFDGDRDLLQDATHQASAVAESPVTACVLYKSDFQRLLEQEPAISLAVIATQARRIDALEAQTTLVTTASVETRLAQWLLKQPADNGAVTLPMKKKALAAYLGTTPETLSRKLRELSDAQLIEAVRPSVIKILDADGLRAV
ncbi:Crp/Fnr family transcriptional regulator [Lacticaseibacillus nasuensis]|uniref:Crp/Fnr family transcriptional regulator n=1 Tax=Lacticaseibacillus nasuensis TaxID=944671 RepID=UPI0022451D29|nr:Crp/Fnr family transcriptional regulator [Lacticaseibacillus nasuensis]MCX2456447.1 Crp/Fnr family transcriptional regulator [Lacticaseibacillus nasuensis]